MVSPVTITNTFNGDISAANYVNAAALDTQLTNLATTINSEIAERQRTVRDGSGLASQVVRFPSLHPEVTAAITAGGLIPKQAAAVVSTANVGSLSGLLTIDGYTLLANDRVLLVGQASAINNGLWVAAAGAWTRPSDSANAAALSIYSFVTVIYGTSQAGSAWYLSAASTVNLTAQNWLIYSSGGILPIVRGGTGASDATTARTNLGATAGIWPITVGGTGASDAATARANLGLGSLAVLSSVTQAQLASDVQYRVDTIAALKALTVTYNSVLVLGYYAPGDGGGGIFRWNGADVTADNGGTVIIPNSGGTGRWNRIYDSGISVKWFGAKGDSVTNDSAAINSAISSMISLSKPLYWPKGTYIYTGSWSIDVAFDMFGDGDQSVVKWTNTSGNAVVIGTASTVQFASIKRMRLLGPSAVNTNAPAHTLNGIVSGASGFQHCVMDNVVIAQFWAGLSGGLCFSNIFTHVDFSLCYKGISGGSAFNNFLFNGCHFINCWLWAEFSNSEGLLFNACEFANSAKIATEGAGFTLFQSIAHMVMPYFENTPVDQIVTVGSGAESSASRSQLTILGGQLNPGTGSAKFLYAQDRVRLHVVGLRCNATTPLIVSGWPTSLKFSHDLRLEPVGLANRIESQLLDATYGDNRRDLYAFTGGAGITTVPTNAGYFTTPAIAGSNGPIITTQAVSGEYYTIAMRIRTTAGYCYIKNGATTVAVLTPLKTDPWEIIWVTIAATATGNIGLILDNPDTADISFVGVYRGCTFISVPMEIPRIIFGVAAPTAGTWRKGDRLVSINPVVGSPKAWACTVAGTPGTWVSEGNL